MGVIQMSRKEIDRLETILKVSSGELSYSQGAKEIAISRRQLIRLVQRYRRWGPEGIVHRNRGKESRRRVSNPKRSQILELLQEKFTDVGPTLLSERLVIEQKLSREWFRKLMIKEGLWKPKRKQATRLYQRRLRRSQEGELIQIDGSYADWFEGRAPKCCLLVVVDDATSKLQELRFVFHETTEDYLSLMKQYIERRGRPRAIYTDRHSVFKVNTGKDLSVDTQFGRAMRELDIELIHANTPQAKGRVERANGVLQDRLIREMRLDGISSMEEGNAYLECFREEYNRKFGKRPQDTRNAHRVMPKERALSKVLCIKEKRKLSKQLTFQFANSCYQLIPRKTNARRLVGEEVLVYRFGEKVIIEHQGQEYAYTIYQERPALEAMGRKELESFLDRKKPLTIIERHRKGIAYNF
jgi:transposase